MQVLIVTQLKDAQNNDTQDLSKGPKQSKVFGYEVCSESRTESEPPGVSVPPCLRLHEKWHCHTL